MKDRMISNTKVGENKRNLLQIEDEDLIFSIKEWTIKIGKSKYFNQYELISNINNLSGIISHLLAQFIHKYLQVH